VNGENMNNQVKIKASNKSIIFNYIRHNPKTFKAELAEITGLTFVAVKNIVSELLELNLIVEDGTKKSETGRKSMAYKVNHEYAYTMGVHISALVIKTAVLDMCGHIVYKQSIPMTSEADSQLALIDSLYRQIEDTIVKSKVDKDKICGIGIGVPGPLNFETGMIYQPPNIPSLAFLPLKSIIEKQFSYPTYVDKDANVIALGEYWAGSAKGYSSTVYIDADLGIGSGIVYDGKIFHGENDGAGEIGHMTIDINGPHCNCGSFGCLETIASGLALVRNVNDALSRNTKSNMQDAYIKKGHIDINALIEAANNDDPLAVVTLSKSASNLGIAIGSLINLMDPQVIVVGGLLSYSYKPYVSIAKEMADRKKLQSYTNNQVVASGLAEDAGLIGASQMVLDDFFEPHLNLKSN